MYSITYVPTALQGIAKLKRDYCIIRHSLRCLRHSDSVIYRSKLPSPSVLTPCDYRMLQSQAQ